MVDKSRFIQGVINFLPQSSRLDGSVSFLLLVLPRDSSAPRRNAVGSLVLVERGEREKGRRGGNWSVAAAGDDRGDGRANTSFKYNVSQWPTVAATPAARVQADWLPVSNRTGR